ncbi:major Facilitator Superfamily protein [Bordetella holmesii 30539]|uniref:PF06779 family protein n=2 Tax=Bordetella holmesii TaxID=35814 RepID=A0A158M6W1_9BORD|nr:major Facilitator Superfamily protein [Bordetella holmesii 44057]EWM45310.1 major Facilitator Superfamily protein [Bordetella holmesii 70147]EWM49429.1 major Facilitator Superfamily protein [Bordetella holmesii 35009]EXF90249.1 major Facilitator Superfamily protein [Bordetella holmesii 30539]EXX94612.1 major Facilitator Superfamily protein [Bordetella holmesii 1058]KAK69645.1 PF06779 family protein [Bordetella holmesii H620]KAK82574.1 PF06779 family protein [Bordetella holmesii CDC-H572-BH
MSREFRFVLCLVFAGFCASLISIGPARFVYTPLLPALIEAHWFSAADAVYLGAANLAGYLVGALSGRALARRWPDVNVLRLMLVLVAASFVGCAFPLSLSWFFIWRLLSGIAGGVVMVLIASTLLPHVPVARRGLASGVIFVGAGLGVVVSGTLVPWLMHWDLRVTWLGLAVFTAVLTLASWRAWPPAVPRSGPAGSTCLARPAAARTATVALLYVQYALMAAAFVPVMVFLVDFIARGQRLGASEGAYFWVLYGVGAMLGPALYRLLIDRFGATLTLRMMLSSQMLAMLALAQVDHHGVLACLTLLLGTFPSGIAPTMLARIHQWMAGAAQQAAVWSRATTAFAVLQAASAYGYSALFNHTDGRYALLFELGAGFMGLTFLMDFGYTALQRENKVA